MFTCLLCKFKIKQVSHSNKNRLFKRSLYQICWRCERLLLLQEFPMHTPRLAPSTQGLIQVPSRCQRCAALGDFKPSKICGSCIIEPPPWGYSIVALSYEGLVKKIMHRFKFQGHRHYYLLLCQLLFAEILRHSFSRGLPDALVPVPSHASRFRERGFSPSHLIANDLSKKFKIPVIHPVKRIGKAFSQVGLTKQERLYNLKGTWKLTMSPQHLYQKVQCQQPHLCLVDDILTTGATLQGLAQALLPLKIHTLDVWCIAKTP